MLSPLMQPHRQPPRTVESKCAAIAGRVRAPQDAELRRLRRDVMRDPLTGLLNRRWMPRFERRLARSPGAAAAVILVDVDGLKSINDRLGHLVGDRRLVQVACALGLAAGARRSVVRFGGDEFLVPMSGPAATDARALAAGLVRAVRASGDGEGGGRMSVSAGVAVGRRTRGGPDARGLLAVADRALRRAKAAGGNCVRWSWA